MQYYGMAPDQQSSSELEQVRNKVRRYCREEEVRAVEKAFRYAEDKLRGLKLSSGKPLFRHNIQTAKMLADLKLDSAVVIAGLVHNLLSLGVSGKDLESEFSEEVRKLVEDRNKLKTGFSREIAGRASKDELFLTMAQDIRAILLELAEKLETIAHPSDLPESTQNQLFEKAKDIYIPLANKLGMYRIKADFEDLLLKHTKPEVFAGLVGKIDKMKKKREKKVERISGEIGAKLKSAGLEAEIKGRAKHLCGIYDKMQRTGRSFEEVYDLSGVRIITDTVGRCYEILGAIHSMWRPLPGEFDDYIAKPKPNQYQSLHTTVIGPDKKPLEVQIRTHEMNKTAELGAAAHWAYKAGGSASTQNRRAAWLKQILEWKRDSKTPTFIDSLKVDFFSSEIFVLTPKGEVIELPNGATTLDFAYAVHTEIGNRCMRAKVNSKVVPVGTKLENADVVEIITSPKQKPKQHWLGIVKTDKARIKIRQAIGMPVSRARRQAPGGARLEGTIKITNKKVKFAKCCSPVFGDEITGVATTKRKVSVHRHNCHELEKMGVKAFVGVEWEKSIGKNYLINLKVTASDRAGLLSDILGEISRGGFSINSTNARVSKPGLMECVFEVKVNNIKDLESVSGNITKVPGVLGVSRA